MYIYCIIGYVRDLGRGLLHASTAAGPSIQNIPENTKKIYKNQKYYSLFKSHIAHPCIISYRH